MKSYKYKKQGMDRFQKVIQYSIFTALANFAVFQGRICHIH